MKKILTKRQQDILDFIESFMQKRGYPPTLREIGNEFGISSTNGVRVNLAALEKKNYIIRRPWLSRGIELVDAPKVPAVDSEIGYVPIVGKVVAAEPIFAAENIEGVEAVVALGDAAVAVLARDTWTAMKAAQEVQARGGHGGARPGAQLRQ